MKRGNDLNGVQIKQDTYLTSRPSGKKVMGEKTVTTERTIGGARA